MNDMSYINYGKEKLLAAPKIPLIVMETDKDIFKAMADEMVEIINRNNDSGTPSVFIVPVGPTGQYPYFVERINREQISLKDTWFINMDEYLTEDDEWISEDHFMSFRGFMNREVYGKISKELLMDEKQRVFPDPRDLGNVERVIDQLGKIDAVFGGIGINGHVAFNEADPLMTEEEFMNLPTRVTDISLETRVVNSLDTMHGAFYAMPKRCVTVGFKDMLRADAIRLGVFRPWHKSVIRTAAYGEKGSWFPVSILRSHKDISIRLPESVAL
ncbi:glucosamine-6-phosphate isomerase [Proteiniclasticum sp. C24MP]|uniref:glucosamine-6-phosphate isomerase n=1 Tax=Proteiniclasticum sp. C24MP TaxID=3374101 RepID=UPI003754D808